MPSDPSSIHKNPAPTKPSFIKNEGGILLGAIALALVLVFMGLPLVTLRTPTGDDAGKASVFCAALKQQLEPHRLKDLDNVVKVEPQRGGRGKIVLKEPVTYSKEELQLIRKEFDRLNVAGNYTLELPMR